MLTRKAWLTLTALLALSSACVGDIDYDTIRPVCEGDQFDAPTRDRYCSGRFAALGEVEVPGRTLGADVRGPNSLIVATTNPVEDIQGLPAPLMARQLNLYHVSTDALFSGELDELDPTAHPEFKPANSTPPLWAPRRVALLDQEGTLGALLAEQFYFNGEPPVHTQQVLFTQADREQGVFAQYIAARTLFTPNIVATDITATMSDTQTLDVFLSLGFGGIKYMRFTLQDGLWGEELPPLSDDATLLRFIMDNPDEFTDLATLCSEQPEPLRTACVAQCEDDCRVADLRPRCAACRLEHGYFRGLSADASSLSFGAWSLASDQDAHRVLVGQFGQVSVYNPESLVAFRYADLERNPAPQEILTLDQAQGVELDEDYVVTQMQLAQGRLYLVAQHYEALHYPIYGGPPLEELAPGVLLSVPWAQGGPTELSQFQGIELPEAFKGNPWLGILALGNGLVMVRGLESERLQLGTGTPLSQEEPVLALYDTLESGQLRPLWEEAVDTSDQYGLQGAILEPGGQRVLLAEPAGMGLYELSIDGDTL